MAATGRGRFAAVRSALLAGIVSALGLLVVAAACSPGTDDSVSDAGESAAAPQAAVQVPTPESSPATPTHSPTPQPGAPYTPRVAPPPVDRDIASVELSDVVFDTFQGGYFPLSEADDRAVESLRDAIKPIYEPVYEPREGGEWLSDDDFVIGYAAGDEAYAYPLKILNYHEIVHDLVGGIPILVSYCPLCASAVVYDRRLDDRVLVFGNTSALYESDMVMYDHQTGSYWFQVAGEAIVGELTGRRLKPLPSITISWGDWKALHPDTAVLSRDLGLIPSGGSRYDVDRFESYPERLDTVGPPFPVSAEKMDVRLRASDKVLAVEAGGSRKAYYLVPGRQWLVNDTVGGRSIVVLVRGSTSPGARAFFSDTAGTTLNFRPDGGVMVDNETGSRWDDTGLAISGKLEGTRLEAAPSRTSFWFSLVGAFPGIDLLIPGNDEN